MAYRSVQGRTVQGVGGSSRQQVTKIHDTLALPGMPLGGRANQSGVIVKRNPSTGATSSNPGGRGGFRNSPVGMPAGMMGNSLSRPSMASTTSSVRVVNAGKSGKRK